MRLFRAMVDSCSSSSRGEEEHAILLGALAVLQQIDNEENKEKLRKRTRWWVRPRIAQHQQFGAFNALVREIEVEDQRAFVNFVRMVVQQFHHLLDVVSPYIIHKDTPMHDAIPPAEHLAVTLCFLATSILHTCVNVKLTFQ